MTATLTTTDTCRREAWRAVEAAQRGDLDAYTNIYITNKPSLLRYVHTLTTDKHLAQDITAETFLRAYRRIGTVTYQGWYIHSWLNAIALNIYRDHLKSNRYKLEAPTDRFDDQVGDDNPETVVIRDITATTIRLATMTLPKTQQDCIQLRFLNDLTVKETSAIMGRSEDAVKALLHRAIVNLRKELEKQDQRFSRRAVAA